MKKTLKIVLAAIAACMVTTGRAQTLPEYERQISLLFAQIEQSDDKCNNLICNDSIHTLFAQALAIDGAFGYAFDNLKFVGKILADDGLLRIYTWNIPTDSGFIYNGYIQKQSGEYVRLTQTSAPFVIDQQQTLQADQWYGALYYRATAYKYRRQKVYLLLGWNGQNAHTQHKIIDVLWFDNNGRAQLGLPILENNNRNLYRHVFEYDADITMYLDYEPDKRRIAFDHLSPIKYFDDETVTLGPDMSVDAYVRRTKGWQLREDVRATNKHKH